MPELCSLESVCGQACVYRHIARCVFTTIFINHSSQGACLPSAPFPVVIGDRPGLEVPNLLKPGKPVVVKTMPVPARS